MENKPMTLNEYQEKAMRTCMPTCNNFSYMMLNLVGEVGELSSKVAKHIRKGEAYIGEGYNELCFLGKEEDIETWETQIALEAGDILWQLAGLCYSMGVNLNNIAQMNLDKLASRKERGVIDGDGDNR